MMQIKPLDEFFVPQVEELEGLCFSLPWSHATLIREIRDPGCVYLAAADGAVLLGYAGMQTVLDEGYINNIAVSPQHRREGVASALLSTLILKARELDLSFLTLEVRAGNAPARALYEKFGFTAVGTRRGYYKKPREDAQLMTLFFNTQNKGMIL